ncbi:MAG: DUF302 domain-containing protein [Bacteroidales bacterium]
MGTGIVVGLVAGLVIAFIAMYIAAPNLMFRETKVNTDFETTATNMENAVAEHGWKIPYVHDMQATLKKFGKDVRSVKVFELCNPDYAYEILSKDEERVVSNMMPCRLAIYEKKDGSVYISRMNSGTVSKPMSKVVRTTMTQAAADVEVMIADVAGK